MLITETATAKKLVVVAFVQKWRISWLTRKLNEIKGYVEIVKFKDSLVHFLLIQQLSGMFDGIFFCNYYFYYHVIQMFW